jgi:hypothetical protein
MSVISKPQQRGGLVPLGLSSHKKINERTHTKEDGEKIMKRIPVAKNKESATIQSNKPDIPLQNHIKTKLEMHLTDLPNILSLRDKFTSL